MHVHEHQAKALLRQAGITTPAGRVASSPEEAAEAFLSLRAERALVKAQIHAGARGKAGGVRIVSSADEARNEAAALLGRPLVTAQTGPHGLPVNAVLVEEAVDVRRECYLGLSLDRDAGCPRVLASASGGMDIEAVGREEPGALLTELGDVHVGLHPYHARKLLAGLGLPHDLMRPWTALVTALGRLFVERDCSLIELNPLVLTADGRLLAADAKMSFDDNALARHPDIADLRDTTQEDPREVEAEQHDLSYIGLEGTVGCMVNGAGLAMATMDLIRLHGAEPANFLDVGGAATAERVTAAFRLLRADKHVRSILINIFGGIVHCDLIAQGVLDAVRAATPDVPLVVRFEGTNAAEGRRLLAESGLEITAADSLEDAAAKAAAAARA